MAQYLVVREPHFRDGVLHPVGAVIEIPKLDNEEGWRGLLEKQTPSAPPPPPKPLTPEEEAAAAKAEVDELLAKLKAAQAKKAEVDKKVPQK